MKLARALLIALGTVVTLFGGWELLTENRPAALMGLAIWLIGGLVLHDGVLAGIIVLTNRLLREFLSGAGLIAAQVGLGVISTFAIIWVPVVLANGKVSQISALPLDYGANLIGVLAVSSLITLAVVIFFTARKKPSAEPTMAAIEVDEAPATALQAEESSAELEQLASEAEGPRRGRRVLPFAAATLLAVGSGVLIFTLVKRRSA